MAAEHTTDGRLVKTAENKITIEKTAKP